MERAGNENKEQKAAFFVLEERSALWLNYCLPSPFSLSPPETDRSLRVVRAFGPSCLF
jgi:hypothetical protein